MEANTIHINEGSLYFLYLIIFPFLKASLNEVNNNINHFVKKYYSFSKSNSTLQCVLYSLGLSVIHI